MTIILGIDPGLTGALCTYDPEFDQLYGWDTPTLIVPRGPKGKRTEIDFYGLALILAGLAPRKVRAVIEQVGATPQMGVNSAFSFGGSYAAARMACAAHFIPTELVSPIRWKRDLRVPASKDGARARASALLPRHAHNWTRAKDDGRAEAALIALWGSQHFSPGPAPQMAEAA